MKRILSCFVVIGALWGLLATQAGAHYVYLQPQGDITPAVGEVVTVGAYLHIESADTVFGWGFSQVFDTDELTRVDGSFVYGNNAVGSIGTVDYEHERDGFTFLARYDWAFKGVDVATNTDYLLYSVSYTFNGGNFGADDVWLDWTVGEDVFFEFNEYVTSLPVDGRGPDYGSNAVPIPGAIWLLGSGLVALVGLNRRTLL